MFNIVKKEIEWGGRKLSIETGKVARQADGAVVVSYGDTVVLCTAVAKKEIKDDANFFPLTINYIEKAYAAGKIPGGFFKREGRPSEKETLTSRLIDRPLRPGFDSNFLNETHVICTVLSHDLDNNPDIVAAIGASAALSISGIPFLEAVAFSRVGYVDGKFILNPLPQDLKNSDLDLVVAGNKSSVLMVESEAKLLSEDIMLEAVKFGHDQFQPVIKLIEDLKSEAGKSVWEVVAKDLGDLPQRIKSIGEKDLRAAYKIKEKQERVQALDNAKRKIIEAISLEEGDNFNEVITDEIIKKIEKEIVRGDIIKTGKRIDGRGEKDIRNIISEVSVLPKTHGSALFTRGETQSLSVATLGTAQDMQIVDALEGEYKESFMLHYNFPPFSVGEASMLRSPGRREIGHGKLAWRALNAVIPSQEEFPYSIRLVSEVTESNGSSSMATVCAGSLSMMDAGVPLKAPVSGIAMGLIKEGDKFSVLSDILGDEDHLGDMDFKVAGSEAGITALQMDIKINGITFEIMQTALEQAKEGRTHIISKMAEALSENRGELNENAPQIKTLKIDKDKIGGLIGPGGKNIREICDTTGAKIDIEEDGTVKIAAIGKEALNQAFEKVSLSVVDAEVGKIYDGEIIKILDFGVLVKFLGKFEGLVHISEIKDERIEDINSAVSMGDKVKVKVLTVDRSGKIRISMRRVNQETGEDISTGEEDDSFGRRGERRGDRKGSGNRSKGPRRSSNDENLDKDDSRGNRKKRFF